MSVACPTPSEIFRETLGWWIVKDSGADFTDKSAARASQHS
jgi:hypothetical protein